MSITWNKNRPAATIIPTFSYKLADNPDLTTAGLRVEYPPDGSSPPHRHGTASVIGYVISGSIICAMNDGEPKLYNAGDSWYEAPGCHHRVSDNASKTERTVIHATFIIKTKILDAEGPGVLVQVDEEYIEGAKEQMERK